MRIIVIMPTYKERENIGRMIDVLFKEEFPRITKHEMHLLVVDDNSPDGTGEIVQEAFKKYKKLHLLSGNRQGLGWAYIRGMRYAMDKLKADAVMEMDADFQHNPEDVHRLVEAYDNGADVVIGSRYTKGGSVPKEWEFFRKFISWSGNMFARVMLFLPQLHDLTTGFRLTRTSFLKKIDLESLLAKESFAYKMDLTFRLYKMKAKIVEVPIAFLPRKKEVSKFSTKETIVTLKVVTLLRLRASERFFKFATVGGIGFMINAIGLEAFRRMEITVFISEYFRSINFPIHIFAQPSAWAAAFAGEVAIFSNFNLDNLWTFRDVRVRASRNPFRYFIKFLQFNLTSVGAIIIQFLVVGLGVILFEDTTLVRMIFLVIAVGALIVPYNYTIYNIFIWKRWSWKSIPWIGWIQRLAK